ncbi:DNA mismatch repair protein [Raphidocelis subcapitata]|uniref:DNA mismatch repair protein n=1 Tax=Raphidocelis subcapitata TaxID=307507 RepID=A0A2V0P139_9CHLO|nr:DNA mismatch repair protein [Raphidocelis subcapitata]|eukprot:GBF93591.1 DNA mismatch repair protein [Raphidocelis subcapitata]
MSIASAMPHAALRPLRTPLRPRAPPPQRRAARAAAATQRAAADAAAPWEEDWDEMGPAFRATLKLLEWPAFCEHVAGFASTAVGKRLCRALEVPLAQAASERMLAETRAVIALELDYTSTLDFGGINTGDAEAAIRRADKGGMVSGTQLRGLVTLLNGAEKLRKQIQTTARQSGAGGRDGPLRPLLAAVSGLSPPAALIRDIGYAVGEEGEVQDAASEQVRSTRARVRALMARGASILKSFPGEVSGRGGRVCVAVAAGTKVAGGVMLGSMPGGGVVFIEPPQVMGINLELIAARAEAMAAEEAVLWELTGRLMGVLHDVTACFDAVMWLDVLAAKARCGTWLGGVLPDFTPWPAVFRPRAAAARRRAEAAAARGEAAEAAALSDAAAAAAAAARADDGDGEGEEGDDEGDETGGGEGEGGGGDGPVVRLKGLSHPLLLAGYLREKERLQRELRLLGADASVGAGGQRRAARPGQDDAPAAPAQQRRRRPLPSRRDAGSSDSEDEEAARVAQIRGRLLDLKPPRPLDLFIQPETTVVVITGPNTGGKTATMKALGLAVLMAKAGMPVPAAAPARLPCYTSVLADIGDEQSLTANLSTFSGHLRRIQGLRAEADGRALLLLDELGTGTDPSEGAALGVALLRRLSRGGAGAGALAVATTHHSLMTKLKFEDPHFENASVEFDDEALAPTYKLLWGVPGRSNALNIAARLGLDPAIVEAARAHLGASASAANAAISDLEGVQGALEREELALWTAEQEEARLKRRVDGMRRAIAAGREELEETRLKSLAAVARAARAVARAVRDERRAAARRANAFDSELSRRLDAAMLDSLAAGPGSVLSAIEQWERLSAGGGGGGGGLAPGAEGEDWWVPAWRGLLRDACDALAAAKAVGSDLDGGSPASSASTWEEDDLARELEGLERTAARRAAARAAAAERRGETVRRAADIERAKQRLWDGGAGDADLDEDLGLGMDLRELERQERLRLGGPQARARAQRESEATAALTRLEEALSKVDVASEARALREAQEREAAEARATAEREAASRAARAQQEAARLASSFEQQLEELEAAAAAAEAVAADGLEAVQQQRQQDQKQQDQQQQQRRRRQDDAMAELLGGDMLRDALAPAGAFGASGGGGSGGGPLDLPPDILELIGALEMDGPPPAAARGGNGTSSSSGGGAGAFLGAEAAGLLADAAWLEGLEALPADGGNSSGGGSGSNTSGSSSSNASSGAAKRKKKRR